MFKVRVYKIESFRDPNGSLGKRIELVEDIDLPSPLRLQTQSEEGRMVTEVMSGLQQVLPGFQMMKNISMPKIIILFLTEEEYDQLAITFDVNQTFSIALENQTIKFTKEETDEDIRRKFDLSGKKNQKT